MQFNYLLLMLLIIPGQLYAARILSVFPVARASQYDFIEPLLKELAGRGHQIISITNYPQQEQIKNFRDIVVEKNKHLFDEYQNFTIESIDINYYKFIDEIYNRAAQMCINILTDPMVRFILKNQTYDLIILDVLFSESLYGLSELLQAPIVGVSNFGAMTSVDELVGNISPLSYVPEFTLTIKDMGFWQRLLNVAIHCGEWLYYFYKYIPTHKKIYDIYFPNALLTFEEAQKNFALVLLNDHFSLTQARPYVPNMIEVAGLNIKTNPVPLTTDIKRLLDNARQGVILVDLELDFNTTKVFLNYFVKISQLIIWQTSQHINKVPSNVFINNNLNLSSIMAHPNVKLYVFVGTFLKVVESVYYGLPILGIYGTGKETDCIDYIKKVGNGLSLKLKTISDKNLAKAFHELLNLNYYAKKAKTLSLRFRDQQNTPMERAVYWIEYVLRHQGAAHLKNRGQNLTWWQFYNVDVLAVIVFMIILVIILALVIVKLVVDIIWNIKPLKNITVKGKKIN